MGIQGFGQYGDFVSNYKINDIPRVTQAPDSQSADVVNMPQNPTAPSTINIEESKPDNRPRFLNPEEVSLGFQKNDDFSYIGRDKDIASLDIQKAISDMKQDSVLQEYQYFVGSAQNVYHSQDGTVLEK